MENRTCAADDACGLCGYWTCRCHQQGRVVAVLAVLTAAPTDSDPDMDEALRRVQGGKR